MTAGGAVAADRGHDPIFFGNVFCHYNTILIEGSLHSAV
jgi:hypothetical protein